MSHFIKVDRSHLNVTKLSTVNNNGVSGWEFSYNWHSFPVFLHILGITEDVYFFEDRQSHRKLHMQTVTHHEHKADTKTEVVLTFNEEMDAHLFLVDLMAGDSAPFSKYSPETEDLDYVTQIDYCY